MTALLPSSISDDKLALPWKQWQIRTVSLNEWREYWKLCTKTNLLQSWQYGSAKEEAEGWQPKRFLISNEIGLPVAIVQVLTREFPVIGGIARINRGPLMLNQLPKELKVSAKFAALRILLKEGRYQRWWVMQIAPELLTSEEAIQGLQSLKLRQQVGTGWASALIDLSLSESELHGKLNRRWKRALVKASNFEVSIEHEKITSSRLEDLLKSYSNLQQRNNFNGINDRLIKVLSKLGSDDWTCNLFVASIINAEGIKEELGYRLCVNHGNTATDFVVSTNEKGRKTEANTALYWHAILHAKQAGCAWFDVGGLNEVTTPKGIAEFKKGLNAEPYELVGEWRSFMIPSFGLKATRKKNVSI